MANHSTNVSSQKLQYKYAEHKVFAKILRKAGTVWPLNSLAADVLRCATFDWIAPPNHSLHFTRFC